MQSIEGNTLLRKQLSVLGQDEKLTLAAYPTRATVSGGQRWSDAILMLTNHRLIISRERLIGRSRTDFAVEWSNISKVSGRPWDGMGSPQIELLVQTDRATIELIVKPQYAVDIESAIRAGYLDR